MDPLSALGIAASVIQFVQFSSSILNSTVKIYQSSEGVSGQSQHLSDVYTRLSLLTLNLQKGVFAEASKPGTPSTSVIQSCSSAIVQLGKDCKADCDKLLGIVRQLQAERTNGRWWKSFRVALKEHLKSDEISQLQTRIQSYETSIMMHLCTLSSQQCMTLGREIHDLGSSWENHLQCYSENIKQIKMDLRTIKSKAAEMAQQNRYVIEKMDVDLLTSKLAAVSMETGLLTKSRDILKSLDYEQRHARHEAIPQAHQETFRWAFHQRQGSGEAAQGYAQGEGDFSRWLQEGDDIFWISGKPGSGKSTLMKFLAGHEDTQCMLGNLDSPRAASDRVVVASHYFWSAGTAIQRTQQGLWRSLLYGILRQDPKLIPQVCAERCKSTETDSCRQPWSLRELLDCIQALAVQGGPGTRFCIFVDGLDEFEGDPLDLINPLQALSKSRLVKLCVASRPWNAFEQAFGHRPDLKIYIQDLTAQDIRAFASDRLRSHPNWGALAAGEDAESIVEDITERSGGVFLWVFLVTRELREGLNNYDTLTDLKRRLYRMPSELGPFFKHILDSVDSFYHGRTAETLRISLAVDEVNNGFSVPFSVYYFHDKEYDDPGLALRMPVEPKVEEHTAMHMRQRVHFRLNGVCKGLLELNGNSVGYIHRTVRDWLRTPEMQQYLMEKSAPIFNPYGAVLSASLAAIKSTRFTDTILIKTHALAHTWHGKLNHRLREALSYVPYAENAGSPNGGAQTFQMIECLGNTTEQLFAVNGAHFAGSPWIEASARNPRVMFRQHLLEARLWHYLAAKLQTDPGFFDQYPATPFYAILKDDSLTCHSRMVWTPQRAESIKCVLAHKQTVVSGCSDKCACSLRVIWTLLARDCLPENILAVETKLTAENLISFKSALEVGIMSTLASRLQLIAEICVARALFTSVPAWFGLILLVLKSDELLRQQQEECLRVFEGILGSPDTDSSPPMNNMDSSNTTLWDVLCRHLQHHKESTARQSDTQEEFLARVMSLILVNAEKRWAKSDQIVPPRELLKSTITSCFPQKSGKHLLSILDIGVERALGRNTVKRKKREADDQITRGLLRKRRQWR